MILNFVTNLSTKKQLELSGELYSFGGNHLSKEHLFFRNVWGILYPAFNDYPNEQKRLLFDFQIGILCSIWHNLNPAEIEKVISIFMNFYDLPMAAIETKTNELRQNLPEYTLDRKSLEKIPSFIDLLEDTYAVFVDGHDYTFFEAASLMPEDLNYPQENAIKVLTQMGYISGPITITTDQL